MEEITNALRCADFFERNKAKNIFFVQKCLLFCKNKSEMTRLSVRRSVNNNLLVGQINGHIKGVYSLFKTIIFDR